MPMPRAQYGPPEFKALTQVSSHHHRDPLTRSLVNFTTTTSSSSLAFTMLPELASEIWLRIIPYLVGEDPAPGDCNHWFGRHQHDLRFMMRIMSRLVFHTLLSLFADGCRRYSTIVLRHTSTTLWW